MWFYSPQSNTKQCEISPPMTNTVGQHFEYWKWIQCFCLWSFQSGCESKRSNKKNNHICIPHLSIHTSHYNFNSSYKTSTLTYIHEYNIYKCTGWHLHQFHYRKWIQKFCLWSFQSEVANLKRSNKKRTIVNAYHISSSTPQLQLLRQYLNLTSYINLYYLKVYRILFTPISPHSLKW